MALTHSERAQLQDRPEEYAAMHRLTIAGEDWSHKLLGASFDWTTEGAAGSNMDFSVEGSLEGYQDAPLTFGFGYGRDDIRTYFRGRVQMPQDHDTLPQSSAVAFGPFRLLTDTFMRNTVTYQGKNLEYIFMDLSRRAEYNTGDFLVLGGKKYNQPAGEIFSMGTSLQEVASSVMAKAKYVAYDAPGGKRVVMPEPKPGSNGSIKSVYRPDNYKTFTTEPNHEVAYHSVHVYRSEGSTWGGGSVSSERVIDAPVRFRPAKSRVFYVSDFPGTQSQAADEAMRLAMALRDGEKKFTMTAPFNREISLYEGFRAVRVKNQPDGQRLQQTYICTIKQISATYNPGSVEMTVSGSCYEVKTQKLTIDQRFEPRATSYGVVVPEFHHAPMEEGFAVPDEYTFGETWLFENLYPSEGRYPSDTLLPRE
jgi:hypothetical protein